MKLLLALSFLCVSLLVSAGAYAADSSSYYNYDPQTGQLVFPSDNGADTLFPANTTQSNLEAERAAEAEYLAIQEANEEAERIRQWERLDREIKLRRYDNIVMGMEKEFNSAKAASNPFLGEQGYIIYPYGEVVPVITCRPLRMTDVALEPGEEIMGIHAGDTVRWQFSPSQSMKNGLAVAHIVVKPSQPGISTNLVIHTDRRTYNLDFTSSEGTQYLRGVAFSYQTNDLTYLFTSNNKKKASDKELEDKMQVNNFDVDLEDMYTKYNIINAAKVDWSPEAVFDDGDKTYIRMPSRFSETPAFYIVLSKKETLTNFRVKGRYYIVDRLFDKAYMKVGSRRVAIVRADKLIDSNIKESSENERLRQLRMRRERTKDGR
ncbi:MAG: TrbG/VirB9 family P-type conjugative transfer protein [Synergistaceae bacterium]|nr:TrbG/VirB9 family P-type conjugative transfer protein [Synergistaceae bacterium]